MENNLTEEQKELLEESLQLLLKLSNKPMFFYVEEVKEIAKRVWLVANPAEINKNCNKKEDGK